MNLRPFIAAACCALSLFSAKAEEIVYPGNPDHPGFGNMIYFEYDSVLIRLNTYELLVNPHKTNIIQHTNLTEQYIDLYISLYTYLKQIKSYSAAESLAPKVRELWGQFLSEEIQFNAKKHEALIKQMLEQRGYSIYGLSEELNRIIIEEDFYDSKSLKNALKVLNYRVKLED